MQNRFIDFIRKNNLANQDDSILAAVSGGIDSMVMYNLLHKAGFKIAVAHCNFGLRGEESDADEQFVKYQCLMSGVAFHSIKFDTIDYAKEYKLSTQVAARELRYNYFDELVKEYKYTKVAIAHNLNDVSETLLLNLTRGTGIKGLAGIKASNGNVIRPLLFATRQEIEIFSQQHDIKFREDSSNSTTKYKRNFIRHKIIPELKQLNPVVDRSIAFTANHIQEAIWLVEEQIDRIRKSVVTVNGNDVLFSIDQLRKERCASFFMVEELSNYGFSPSSASQVVDLINSESGRRVESQSHAIYRDRNNLILVERKSSMNDCLSIDASIRKIETPINLNIDLFDDVTNLLIERNPSVALIDFDKLKFPLSLRVWADGDKFMPFGMNGYKKISDFLVDNKVPMHKKSNVYVLLSGNEIVWVIGYRIDNRFRIDKGTKKVLRFELE